MGPGYLVAVGYMDPGKLGHRNSGGSSLGSYPVSVIVISSFDGDVPASDVGETRYRPGVIWHRPAGDPYFAAHTRC